jgi:hypothetical protein
MRNYLPRRGCAQISGNKKPAIAAGFDDSAATRALPTPMVANFSQPSTQGMNDEFFI